MLRISFPIAVVIGMIDLTTSTRISRFENNRDLTEFDRSFLRVMKRYLLRPKKSTTQTCELSASGSETLAGVMAGQSSSLPNAFMVPTLLRNETLKEIQVKSAGSHYVEGAEDCQAGSRNVGDPLSLRAVCPYRVEVNYDPLRIPAVVFESKCACDHRPPTETLECEPVNVRMRVLRFADSSCPTPTPESEVFTMGCVTIYAARSDEPNSTPSVEVVHDEIETK